MLFQWLLCLISPVLLWTIAIAVLIPSTVFCIECLANIWAPGLDEEGTNDFSTSFNILIPAHNEAEKISLTLQGLISEVCETDRIVVIADNCTDATAKIARAHGVTVFERDNSSQLGKGYALDFALEQLQMHPPEVVIVVDADCQVSPGTVALLAAQAHLQQRPIQVTYSMELGEQGTITDRISAFAIKVRNVVRSIGMARLGYPCVLAGSGMAFPWDILQKVSLAGSKCVDDMQLTIDLAIAGHTPTYTTAGQVTGRLMQNQAAQSQRSRWEHGHLEVIFTQVPKLLWEGWRQQRFDLVMLALDLSVPPLSLLVLLWLLAFSLSGLFWVLGWVSWFPLAVLALAGSLLSLGLSVAWVKVGRQDLPMLTLFSIPIYLFWKLPIYLKFFVRPQTRWLKTERDIEPETSKQ